MGSHTRPDPITSELDINQHYTAPSPMDIVKTFPVVAKTTDLSLFVGNTVDRVSRTVVQTVVGYTTVQAVHGGAYSVMGLLGVVLGAAVLSFGTCLISAPSFGSSWWFQVCERAVKTFVQTFIAGMTVATIGGINFSLIPSGYTSVIIGSAISALASLTTSFVSTTVGPSQEVVDVLVPDITDTKSNHPSSLYATSSHVV